VWTSVEESLFRVMIKTFPGNFCAVAQLMASKRCREVFRFSLQEGKLARARRPARHNGTKVRYRYIEIIYWCNLQTVPVRYNQENKLARVCRPARYNCTKVRYSRER
jgi:hypothetical protein